MQRENPIEEVSKSISNQENFTYGAFKDEELVGVITLLQETPQKLRHKANILGMYVSPKMRGMGFGKALLHEAIKKAKNIETVEKLNLSVVTSNENAKNLYSQLGFEIFATEKNALKLNNTSYDEFHMSLKIR